MSCCPCAGYGLRARLVLTVVYVRVLGVVPVTLTSAADIAAGYEPQTDDVELAEAAKRAVSGSEGMPVAVQVRPHAFGCGLHACIVYDTAAGMTLCASWHHYLSNLTLSVMVSAVHCRWLRSHGARSSAYGQCWRFRQRPATPQPIAGRVCSRSRVRLKRWEPSRWRSSKSARYGQRCVVWASKTERACGHAGVKGAWLLVCRQCK
jgi:hypothetical protein